MFVLRHSVPEDIPVIMELIAQAQMYFRENGVDQWQNGYPNENVILNDIHNGNSYVLLCDAVIVATAVISFNPDPNYTCIDGEWITANPYAVVHRVAVRSELKGRNLAGRIIEETERMCRERGYGSIRIDTHRDNHSMQQVIRKKNFIYCGIIKVADGAPRLAFEKVLQ